MKGFNNNLKQTAVFAGLLVLLVLLSQAVSYVQKITGEVFPVETTVAGVVAFAIYAFALVTAIRQKPTWVMHIIILLVLGVGGYFYALRSGWGSPYWGVFITTVLWIGLFLIDIRVRGMFKKVNAKVEEKKSGRSDEFSANITVDEPGGKKRTGMIDLSNLFSRADADLNLQTTKAINEAAEKVTGLMQTFQGYRQIGLLSDEQVHNALKKLGIWSLFEGEAKKEEDPTFDIVDYDDEPRR